MSYLVLSVCVLSTYYRRASLGIGYGDDDGDDEGEGRTFLRITDNSDL